MSIDTQHPYHIYQAGQSGLFLTASSLHWLRKKLAAFADLELVVVDRLTCKCEGLCHCSETNSRPAAYYLNPAIDPAEVLAESEPASPNEALLEDLAALGYTHVLTYGGLVPLAEWTPYGKAPREVESVRFYLREDGKLGEEVLDGRLREPLCTGVWTLEKVPAESPVVDVSGLDFLSQVCATVGASVTAPDVVMRVSPELARRNP